MRFVNINGHRWAIDLTWYVPPTTASGRIDIRSVQETIRGEGANYWTRRGNQIAYGTSDGGVGKTHSLAGWISIPYNSFIGIFPLRDEAGLPLWWLFARINGNNIGGYGDTVYESAEEAERGKQELLDLYPEHNELEDIHVCKTVGESVRFLEPLCRVGMFSGLNGDAVIYALEKMRSRRAVVGKKVILGMLGAGAIVGVGIFAHQMLAEMGLTAAAKRSSAAIEQQRRTYSEHPEKVFKQVWQEVPVPTEIAGRCLSGMGVIPYTVSGWKFEKAFCVVTPGPAQTKYHIRRSYGQTPASSFERLPENARVDNVKLLEIMDTLPPAPFVKNDLEYGGLMKKETIRRAFLQISQQFSGVKTQLVFKQPEKRTMGEAGTFTCPWVVGAYEISNLDMARVMLMSKILERIPGIVLKTVSTGGNGWQLKGELFGLP